jgi:hypothetical protein
MEGSSKLTIFAYRLSVPGAFVVAGVDGGVGDADAVAIEENFQHAGKKHAVRASALYYVCKAQPRSIFDARVMQGPFPPAAG